MMWTKSKPESQIEVGTATCLFGYGQFKAGETVNFTVYTILDEKKVKLNGTIVIPYIDFLWNFDYLGK